MEKREVQIIKGFSKPKLLSLKCPECGGSLVHTVGNNYQCSYCDVGVKLIDGKFEKQTKEEQQVIEDALIKKTLDSIIDTYSDEGKQVQTIVSVDKSSSTKKKIGLWNMLLIDLGVALSFIETIGLDGIKKFIGPMIIGIINGIIYAYNKGLLGNKTNGNDEEETNQEEYTGNNGRMHV